MKWKIKPKETKIKRVESGSEMKLIGNEVKWNWKRNEMETSRNGIKNL